MHTWLRNDFGTDYDVNRETSLNCFCRVFILLFLQTHTHTPIRYMYSIALGQSISKIEIETIIEKLYQYTSCCPDNRLFSNVRIYLTNMPLEISFIFNNHKHELLCWCEHFIQTLSIT